MTRRNDKHAPSTFDPAAYDYQGTVYVGPSEDGADYNDPHAWAQLRDFGFKGGNFDKKGTCDHCGARFSYGAVFQHTDGKAICVGHTCAARAFAYPSRAAYDLDQVKARVAGGRKVAKFCDAHKDGAALLEAFKVDHHIIADMHRRLKRWGKLSDKQVAFALRLAAEASKTAEEKEAEAKRREEENTARPDVVDGRRTVTGKIVSTRVQEGHYGTQYKMLFVGDDGEKLWGSIPRALLDAMGKECGRLFDAAAEAFEAGDEAESDRLQDLARKMDQGYAHTIKGARVEFAATVEASKDDPKFGFYKRPSKAKILAFPG
jgi:hypothetical protein